MENAINYQAILRLYKYLNASLSSNYRAISLTTIRARVFEKVVLEKYIDNLTVSNSQIKFKT